MSGPLAGLRVVEMTGLGPCPLAGQLLADLGADVIAIDRKSGKADPYDINRRGKRSLAVNLKSADGLVVLKKLVGTADILIEGFRPGVMEKLGLAPSDCHAINPGLIYGRMTGWGQDGPMAQAAGHDINYLALTGILAATGNKADEPPVPPLNMVADYGGGTMFLLLGVLAALFERSSSGKGQVVDAAMVDGASALSGLLHMMRGHKRWVDQRGSNLLDGGAPFYRCYECKDGKSISLGPLEPQFFAEFVRLAGLPQDHCKDQIDPRNWAERSAEYAAVFKTKTRDEWAAIFGASDACAAPVMELSELMDHPHTAARGTFVEVDGVVQAAAAPRFDRTPNDTPMVPGAPGADTAQILDELGLGVDDITDLTNAGALT